MNSRISPAVWAFWYKLGFRVPGELTEAGCDVRAIETSHAGRIVFGKSA